MDKIIVTDCDGVLLNWEYAFDCWMEARGYPRLSQESYDYCISTRYDITRKESKKFIKLFNESAAIGFLPALRDATYYVKLLHEKHGYRFDVVTSLSIDPYATELRTRNLHKIFGETTFRSIVCLDTGADKDDYLLEHYGNSSAFWIEDKLENAYAGLNAGMKPILMEHGHNMNEHVPFPITKNWEEIYGIITQIS